MTGRHTRLAGLVAAAFVAATGLVGLSQPPASAAWCSGAGVNVVVDYQGLGGGAQKGCDPNGGGRAAKDVFPAAGFRLTYAQREQGFVCRVNGKPTNDPCVNASPVNAYWGLFWSDGKSGKWTYASSGVAGLEVPNGGFVAFSWQNGGSQDPPGVSPVNSRPTPKPTPKPKPTQKPKPTKKPSKTATAKAAAQATTRSSASSPARPTASATTPASPSASASKPASASASASASVAPPTASDDGTTPEAEAAPGADTQLTSAEPDAGGLPLWVPGAIVVALGAATGGVLWWRRSGGRSGA